MDKKQELINEIEAAKKEFYAKNPCKHCVGNGCDDCRDCSEAGLRYQLEKYVYDLEKKFEQTYGEDYDTFKEKEKNKKLKMRKQKSDKFDLTKLTAEELYELRADINSRIFSLAREDEEAKAQEFRKTLEIGGIYCVKNYYCYSDNTVYTIKKINGFEPKEGRPHVQYTYYYITNKPDKLSITAQEIDVPIEAISGLPIFRNRITKDAEAIFSEIENLYNRATTQLDVINTGIFEKTNKLLQEHCKNLKD